MNRSGYSFDYEYMDLYRNSVDLAISGKRGQAFLREMAAAMDAMPVKELISELIECDGRVCAIGTVFQSRGLNTNIDDTDQRAIANVLGIARCLAAEIAYENDEGGVIRETPEMRWQRMRKWVDQKIEQQKGTP